MRRFLCQPAYYLDRTDTWECDAKSPKEAAEKFMDVYDSDNGTTTIDPQDVRVMFEQSEWRFEVRGEASIQYTAKERN